MKKVLSIHIGHDATAMYIDRNSMMAISEERVSRIKNFHGFPMEAINKIFEEKRINWNAIDQLIITSKSIKNSKSFRNFFYFNYISVDFLNEIPLFARILFLVVKRKTFDNYLKDYLYKKNFSGEIIYYDHHLCHIASSLATYPIDGSYLLSLDGGGDGINWSFFLYKNKKLQLLENSKTFYKNKSLAIHDTPADIYSNTTKFLGFKRLKDEGKIMGLSSTGKPKYFSLFNSLLTFRKRRFICKFGSQKRDYLQQIMYYLNFLLFGKCYDLVQINYMKKYFKENYNREDIAASLQKWCEKITSDFLNYLSKKYRFKKENLILSGGFFSNVLINQMIKERKDINNVMVTPNMGDGGLVLGGIYLGSSNSHKRKFFNGVAKNVFYGSESKIDKKKICKKKFQILEFTEKKLYDYVSDYLIQNKIVGIINGKMEFGPRALGNRSIIANPSNKNITEILNKKLNRSEFMPFAPFFLDKDAEKFLKNYKKSDYSSKFMTLTYNVKANFKNKIKHIIHHDNTIRAQIIDKKNNSCCYGILSVFSKKSGIPCLINTSFNSHEEPIIMDIIDAINALENNVVDLIVNDTKIIKKK